MKKIERTFPVNGKDSQVFVRNFSGISDVQKFIRSTPADDGWRDHTDEYELSYEFNGERTYEEATKHLLEGKNIAELKKAIRTGRRSHERQVAEASIVGCAVNVPAYLAGSPACMYRMQPAKKPGAYDVFVDIAVSAIVTKSQITEAGKKILANVLDLATKYPVNLYIGNIVKHDGKYHGDMTKIIDAGKPFNVARVSYALTEPGMLRVFGFCIIERNEHFLPTSAAWGYGTPTDNAERVDICKSMFKNPIVLSTKEVINGGEYAFRDIQKLLKKGGKR